MGDDDPDAALCKQDIDLASYDEGRRTLRTNVRCRACVGAAPRAAAPTSASTQTPLKMKNHVSKPRRRGANPIYGYLRGAGSVQEPIHRQRAFSALEAEISAQDRVDAYPIVRLG